LTAGEQRTEQDNRISVVSWATVLEVPLNPRQAPEEERLCGDGGKPGGDTPAGFAKKTVSPKWLRIG
jgi:hypothetical protein